MSWEGIFRIFIRIVFLFAYGAFLSASIRHIATFFHNFEPGGNDWTGSYTLAISIDVTALVLTIGVMFFRKSMPGLALGVVWFFIIALTAFSWLVNWEYAMRYQSDDLTTDTTLKLLNPILASAFAFLNLAYSVVAEFFSTKRQTAEELAQEAERVQALAEQQRRLDAAKALMKKPNVIQRTKELLIEAKTAAQEVRGEREEEEAPAAPQEPLPEKLGKSLQFLCEHEEDTNNGGPADNSEDETLEHTASFRSQKTSSIAGRNATPGDGIDQSEHARKTSSRATIRDGSITPLSVTVKEAATMLGLSESYVRELRSNKKLRGSGRNKKLILVSSIKAYQTSRQKTGQNESYESQENTHQNGERNKHFETAILLD
jgi:Helix-turn-helix domain